MATLNKFIRGKKGQFLVKKSDTSINIIPEGGTLKLRLTFTLDESHYKVVDKAKIEDDSEDFTMVIGENLHEIHVDHDLYIEYMNGDGRLHLRGDVKLDPTKAKDKHG
jgi:hypothetical protein